MKKILIITYYFPPYTGIEGQRIKSWANNFYKHGLLPTVITRHWNHIPKNWEDYHKEDNSEVAIEENEKGKIIRLAYKLLPLYKKIKRQNIPILTSVYYYFQKIRGTLQIETDAFYSFYGYADELLQKEKYDLILVSSPPLNLIKLGYKLSKKYKIPLATDFRDNYNNEMLRIDYKPSILENANNFVTQFYLKRWLKRASLVTSVTESICDILAVLSKKGAETIYNGYEKDIFLNIKKEKRNKKFTISCVGNLYPQQDISFMLEGFVLFLKDKSSEQVCINFIGLNNQLLISENVKQALPSQFVNITGRIKRDEALGYMKNSQILYYPGWPEYRGVYSGKIFEYLASGNNILIAPNDNGVLDSLIIRAQAGKVAGSPAEMAAILNDWYREWKLNGDMSYRGNPKEFEKFTREAQAEKLANLLENINETS